jgi:PleD family two-component response regulator
MDLTTETDLTPAMQRADRALYNAKKTGRNRVM